MINRFCKTPLWKCSEELIQVAQGEKPADLVIRHANLVSVTTHEILPDTDLFLFDIKTLDPEKHRRFTGQENSRILDNLHALDRAGAELHLRCPLIPGWNDSPEELDAIAALVRTLSHVRQVEVEPYHPLGVPKARRLGMERIFEAPFPPKELPAQWIARIASGCSIPVIRQ